MKARAAAALASYVLLVVWLTWPLATHLGTHLPDTHDACHYDLPFTGWMFGWESHVLHRTGRSLGYSTWDGHELKADSPTVLEPGMVMTVEPGIYVDGIGGARFGDTVLVTETGCEVLTPFDLGRDV